mgnify:CR=1 FL=1
MPGCEVRAGVSVSHVFSSFSRCRPPHSTYRPLPMRVCLSTIAHHPSTHGISRFTYHLHLDPVTHHPSLDPVTHAFHLVRQASKLSLDHTLQMASVGSAWPAGHTDTTPIAAGGLRHVNRAVRAHAGLFDEVQAAPYNRCSQRVFGMLFATLSVAAGRFESLAEMDAPIGQGISSTTKRLRLDVQHNKLKTSKKA